MSKLVERYWAQGITPIKPLLCYPTSRLYKTIAGVNRAKKRAEASGKYLYVNLWVGMCQPSARWNSRL